MMVSLILILTSLFSQPHLNEAKTDFGIKITQSTMLTVDTFKIDNNSIIVVSRGLTGSIKKHQQLLTKDQSSKIERQLKQIDLADLKSDYTKHDFPDDHYEFDFGFNFGQRAKSVHIYGEVVTEILKLTEILNSILPTDFQVKYDQAYVKL